MRELTRHLSSGSSLRRGRSEAKGKESESPHCQHALYRGFCESSRTFAPGSADRTTPRMVKARTTSSAFCLRAHPFSRSRPTRRTVGARSAMITLVSKRGVLPGLMTRCTPRQVFSTKEQGNLLTDSPPPKQFDLTPEGIAKRAEKVVAFYKKRGHPIYSPLISALDDIE